MYAPISNHQNITSNKVKQIYKKRSLISSQETKAEKSILITYFIQINHFTIFYKINQIMGMNFPNRRILSTIIVIIFFVLVVSSQLRVSCRPLQDDEWSRELVLQLLPRGTSKPSSPDPIHPWLAITLSFSILIYELRQVNLFIYLPIKLINYHSWR